MTSVGAVLMLAIVQYGYTWVTANVLNYNRIYGSLAVIPLFLIWILLFWIVFLLGAAACATVTQRLGRRSKNGGVESD
jgi:membrane protein